MPTNPYSSQSITGYNAGAPADDGSQVSSNQLEWDKHKTKLGDPLKTLAEAINTAAVSFGAKTVNTDADEDNAIAGSLAFTPVNATVTDGVITPLRSNLRVDTEGAAASDELTHFVTSTATNSPREGAVMFVAPLATARQVTIKDRATSTATGSIHLLAGTDIVLDELQDQVLLQLRGKDWYQVGGADNFRVFSTATEPPRRGYIDGLDMANTATDIAADLDIGPGSAALANSAGDLKIFNFATTAIKQIDANWATGSPAGGMPSSITATATSTYHVFALGNATFGVEYGFDTSVSATTLLATATGFAFHRRIGSVHTGTATDPTILGFTQRGDHFVLHNPPLDVAKFADLGTTATNVPLTVPSGIVVDAVINVEGNDTGNWVTYISPTVVNDEAPAATDGPLGQLGINNGRGLTQMNVLTNTSGQIRIRASLDTMDSFNISTIGWRDERGQNATATI